MAKTQQSKNNRGSKGSKTKRGGAWDLVPASYKKFTKRLRRHRDNQVMDNGKHDDLDTRCRKTDRWNWW